MYNQTILTGILISLLYTELTGFSAGLIIPGYLALHLHSPLRLIFTFLISLAAVVICRILSRFLILFGRRRFAMLILLTFFLGMLVHRLGIIDISMIGILIPGIMAREIDRQGFLPTICSMTLTTCLTALVMILCGYPFVFL